MSTATGVGLPVLGRPLQPDGQRVGNGRCPKSRRWLHLSFIGRGLYISSSRYLETLQRCKLAAARDEQECWLDSCRVMNLGLYAARPFYRGDIITEADGEIITNEVACRRRSEGLGSHIVTLCNGKSALDGRFVSKHSIGRGAALFANSTYGSNVKPNASWFKTDYQLPPTIPSCVRDGGDCLERVWLKATRDIRTGEEILTTYGRGYFERIISL